MLGLSLLYEEKTRVLPVAPEAPLDPPLQNNGKSHSLPHHTNVIFIGSLGWIRLPNTPLHPNKYHNNFEQEGKRLDGEKLGEEINCDQTDMNSQVEEGIKYKHIIFPGRFGIVSTDKSRFLQHISN